MCKTIELKKGIKLHVLDTEKYKTCVVAVFLTTKLNRENVTKNALIPAVLRMGTNNIKTQQDINKKLEELYGANFNCGVEKRGDNHVLKFYIETINNQYTLNKEDVLKESMDLIFDIILNPCSENGGFSKEYVEGEKENLKRLIEGKIDNKTTYAYNRCLEEMYNGRLFGLYQYGYVEDLQEINEMNLFSYYKELLNTCKIDVFVSGKVTDNLEKLQIKKYIEQLIKRDPNYFSNSDEENIETERVKQIEEKMDITQGKLVIGLDIKGKADKASCSVYNAILGGGANSKLFQNVREKASLAYTAGSGFLKTKNVIVIRCGIEIKNKDRAIEIIRKQLKDMKDGMFDKKNIDDAKNLIIAGLKSIQDDQIGEISYEMSEELCDKKTSIDEFINQIRDVKKQDIVNIANSINENTIYFLRN